jgi:hypothetical protein
MLNTLPWIVALVVAVVLVPAAWWLGARQSRRKDSALPDEWALVARPIFSSDERRVFRQLRDALPHHIIVSKLPLVRFCQPTDPQRVRFWYDLLGSLNITFAICSANGRVLAALDLDTDRGDAPRALRVKQSVLGACRVRYLRCPVDQLPSIAELQLLVPPSTMVPRGPQPAPARTPGYRGPADGPSARRRRERKPLWQESTVFQDSFFGTDSRSELNSGHDLGPDDGSHQHETAIIANFAKSAPGVRASDDDGDGPEQSR